MNSVCWFGELARARSLGHAYFSKLKSSQNKLKFEKQAQAELFETIHSVFVKKNHNSHKPGAYIIFMD